MGLRCLLGHKWIPCILNLNVCLFFRLIACSNWFLIFKIYMCKFALMNVDSATALTELIFACSMKMKDKKRRCLRLVGEPTCASKKRRQTNEADHGASASRQTSGRRCWKPVLSRGIGEAADLGRRRGGRPRGVGVGNQCLPRRQTSEKRRQTTGRRGGCRTEGIGEEMAA
jgi:hypothetical protein